MHLAELLQSLGERLRIEGLQLNDQGVCRLVIGESLEINIEHASVEDSVHVYAVLGKAPDFDREKFFAGLLEAQHFAREIGEGCAFGLDSATGEILLHRKMTVSNLTEETLQQALNEFVNWAEHWQEKLSSETVFAEPGKGGFTEDFSSGMFIRG
jgi:hypothetical protein